MFRLIFSNRLLLKALIGFVGLPVIETTHVENLIPHLVLIMSSKIVIPKVVYSHHRMIKGNCKANEHEMMQNR